jgi:hypothetical protein
MSAGKKPLDRSGRGHLNAVNPAVGVRAASPSTCIMAKLQVAALQCPAWNYTVRLYRPRAQILSGKWTFPEPQPVH